MFTCIRCYHEITVDLDTPDQHKIRCPECGFTLTTGDIKFFTEALADDGEVSEKREICEIVIPVPAWLAELGV